MAELLPTYTRLKDAKKGVMVDMDDVKFCQFTPSSVGIGTRGLNGCHVVVIFSRRAAVLAHIAPGPGMQQSRRNPPSMDAHVAKPMQTVKDVYTTYRSWFPNPGSETHTVHAWFNGELSSPNQKELIAEHLRAMGLPDPTSHRYDVVDQAPTAEEERKSPKGTVVLVGSTPPRLLVEDKIVAPLGQKLVRSSPSANVRSSDASASSSAAPATTILSSGIPADHSGWVFIQNTYQRLSNGKAVRQQQHMPPGESVFNPNGWQDSAKRWARWDGNPKHAAEYR